MRWPCARLGVRGRRRCRPCEEHLHRRLTGTERWRLRLLLGPGRLRGTCDHHRDAGERVEPLGGGGEEGGISLGPRLHSGAPRNIPEPSPGVRFACERGLGRTDLADKPGGRCPFAWQLVQVFRAVAQRIGHSLRVGPESSSAMGCGASKPPESPGSAPEKQSIYRALDVKPPASAAPPKPPAAVAELQRPTALQKQVAEG